MICLYSNGFFVVSMHSFSTVHLFQFVTVTFISLQVKKFEKLESDEERIKVGKEIYDQFIMKELLSQSHVSTAKVSVTV